MPYISYKRRKNGRYYAQLQESYRVGKKVKTRYIASLGPVNAKGVVSLFSAKTWAILEGQVVIPKPQSGPDLSSKVFIETGLYTDPTWDNGRALEQEGIPRPKTQEERLKAARDGVNYRMSENQRARDGVNARLEENWRAEDATRDAVWEKWAQEGASRSGGASATAPSAEEGQPSGSEKSSVPEG